jgi:mannose-6-phosphate isomerase-like protein (cupin superfamily)
MGAAIRDRRKRLGLTLQQVAELSACPLRSCRRWSATRLRPRCLLEALARALDVELDYFTRVPTPSQVVARADGGQRIELGSSVVYERLSGRHAERKMEALRLSIPAGSTAPTMRREGEGFWYILSGHLQVKMGRRSFVLAAGDSAHFDQRHPYDMHAVDDVRMIWVALRRSFTTEQTNAVSSPYRSFRRVFVPWGKPGRLPWFQRCALSTSCRFVRYLAA